MINKQVNYNALFSSPLFVLPIKFFLVLLISFSPFISYAQNCTSASLNEGNARIILPSIKDFGGSTFIACKTGLLTTLTFRVTDSSNIQPVATLFLENGVGNGATTTKMTADYSQIISIPGNGAMVSIDLTTPFTVEKDAIYTWYIQKDPKAGRLIQAAGLEPNNSYQEGQTWYNNEVYPTYDNLFTVSIESKK